MSGKQSKMVQPMGGGTPSQGQRSGLIGAKPVGSPASKGGGAGGRDIAMEGGGQGGTGQREKTGKKDRQRKT